MASIRSVRWRPFELPLRDPALAAHGAVATRAGIVVVITDRDGTTGLGEASPLTSYAGGTVAEGDAIIAEWAPRTVGMSAEEAWDSEVLGSSSVSSGARAAVRCGLETALADLLARRAGLSLHSWLAPSSQLAATIPANGLVDKAGSNEAAAEAASLVAAGFGTLKLKVGFGLEIDSERLAAVRLAVGAEIELRVDANGAWDEPAALAMLEPCRAAGVSLIEQPLSTAAGAAALAAFRSHAGGILIAADEGCRFVSDFDDLVAAGAIDAVVVKPMVSGLREAVDIIAAAEIARIPVIVTTTFDSGIGTALAMHLAAMLPPPRLACGLATYERLADDFVSGVPAVSCGRVILGGAPGLGVELNLTRLERLATGPWREVSL